MKLKLPKEKLFTGPASVIKRFIAFIVDMLIIDLVITLPFRGMLQKLMPTNSFKDAYQMLFSDITNSPMILVIMTITGILSIFYFALLEYRLNQSIGKILLGIFVRNDMKKKRFWQYLVRSVFLLPFFPFVILWLLDPIFMFFTKDNRRLSEILSKTRTVQSYVMR